MAAGPQKFIAGPTIARRPALGLRLQRGPVGGRRLRGQVGLRVEVRLVEAEQVVRPAGRVAVQIDRCPRSSGTNSMPVMPAPRDARHQSYHQRTAGENAAPGAVLAAMPRLHGAPPVVASPAPRLPARSPGASRRASVAPARPLAPPLPPVTASPPTPASCPPWPPAVAPPLPPPAPLAASGAPLVRAVEHPSASVSRAENVAARSMHHQGTTARAAPATREADSPLHRFTER